MQLRIFFLPSHSQYSSVIIRILSQFSGKKRCQFGGALFYQKAIFHSRTPQNAAFEFYFQKYFGLLWAILSNRQSRHVPQASSKTIGSKQSKKIQQIKKNSYKAINGHFVNINLSLIRRTEPLGIRAMPWGLELEGAHCDF